MAACYKPTIWGSKFKFSHFANFLIFPKCINVYRDYIANGSRFIPEDLNEIISYHRIIACSSAECKRGFTSMK